jgi:SulP family sulfate permease
MIDLTALRTFPVLSDFSDMELADLFANASEQQLSPGSFLCREGEQDGHLYFLVSGEVEVTKRDAEGQAHRLAQLSSGTLLGELAWIMGTPCTASVVVRQQAQVVQLDGATLGKQLQARSPGAFKLGVALLRLLASRLMRMNEQFLALDPKTNSISHKKSEIERLRERILHDWSF